MKILVLSTRDIKGGAAQISWEIRKRLKAEGHTVSTFVRYKDSEASDVFVIPRKKYQDKLVKLFANDLTFANTGYIFSTKEYKEADIIHCHNLHSNFFNLKDLIRMSREKPVIWTIHDLWAITGYANDSVTLKNPNKKKFLLFFWDTTSYLLAAKKRIYERSKLHIVAVSEWLKDCLENSVLKNQEIVRIHNGVDTRIFHPSSKLESRKRLNLPLDKKIIGFPKKGWLDSSKIMDLFSSDDTVFFIALGHNLVQSNNPNHIVKKTIDDRSEMADYLNSLDVLFYPTQGDTFGLTAAEALAVGTPVVSYATDALPEIIINEKTGYLIESGNIKASYDALKEMCSLSATAYDAISKTCARSITDKFSIEKMYSEYKSLYNKLLKR